MPYYNLWRASDSRTFFKSAADRDQALAEFAAEAGARLTFEDTGGMAPYMFGEADANAHCVRTDIPVFAIPNQDLARQTR